MAVEKRNEPVNLGNPVEFTIRELAEEVARVVGKEMKISYRPLPQDDPAQRQPDITRAREWLGWEPKIQLAQGLERTVEFFKSRPVRDAAAGRQAAEPSPRSLDSLGD
jgi:nucleoside-diphosphate-sugar epimerase